MQAAKSKSLPFMPQPAALDGTMAGEVQMQISYVCIGCKYQGCLGSGMSGMSRPARDGSGALKNHGSDRVASGANRNLTGWIESDRAGLGGTRVLIRASSSPVKCRMPISSITIAYIFLKSRSVTTLLFFI